MCQFGQLVLRKIIETVANLPPDLILKLQFNAPNSISRLHWAIGGAYSAPRTPTWILRVLLQREARGGEEAKKGKEGEGTKRGREGNGGRHLPPTPQFATPLG